MEERLQKIISAAGVCSRRAAEKLLVAGQVTVNGHMAAVGEKADAGKDVILVSGKPLPTPGRLVCLMLHKPRGYVTTLSDEKGRPTVVELVSDCGLRVYPAGRLDMDSEGLLLLTNDGELMQNLLHPSFEIAKTYEVSVNGAVEHAAENLAKVRDLAGEPIAPALVETLWQGARSAVLSVTIHQGKNRQIRRMCKQCGLFVQKLKRVREHTLQLGALPLGKWRYLTEAELASLRRAQ